MLTTAGLMRSTTSAKLTSDVDAPAAGLRPTRPDPIEAPPAATEERETPPAKIAPTRKATRAVNPTVTSVKRRDIIHALGGSLALHIDYKPAKRVLIEDFDAELLRLFELAPCIRSGDDVRGFAAHRFGDLGA